MYTPRTIAQVLQPLDIQYNDAEAMVQHLAIDTRSIIAAETTLFFAIKGNLHDGHDYVHLAITLGVRNIVLEYIPTDTDTTDVNLYIVDDSVRALQRLAAYHRAQYPHLPILAITGSNGKTTVKEWLATMINDRTYVKNPRSYNSQIGVPLSVWAIKEGDELGIFEAGISQVGEMNNLANILKPDLGLFTNIGDAHDLGFESTDQKIKEKLSLFSEAKHLILCQDHKEIYSIAQKHLPHVSLLTWGKDRDCTLFTIEHIDSTVDHTTVTLIHLGKQVSVTLGFTDAASIQNALHCIAVCLALKVDWSSIISGLARLSNLPMRLEMKTGIQSSILINDTYNADIQSLTAALQFHDQQAKGRSKVLVISGFDQLDLTTASWAEVVCGLIQKHGIHEVLAIGTEAAALKQLLPEEVTCTLYPSVDQLIDKKEDILWTQKVILVKGARRYALDRVIAALSEKINSAQLVTDLQAIDHNLRYISSMLTSGSSIVPVIKASAYGSGSDVLGKFLEYRQVACLAVAHADEGIQLRQSGVGLPIIILNPEDAAIEDMIRYRLEPEVYSMFHLEQLIEALDGRTIGIHLKLDTGMHRLGFMEADIDPLIAILIKHSYIKVISIFSHLSASEASDMDHVTHAQVSLYTNSYNQISDALGYKPKRHILNSSGILRFPDYHMDWVRLGLALYGIDSTGKFGDKLLKAHTLKASILQIKSLKKGDLVGYNGRGQMNQDGRIAIINIGYADGLRRAAGNGKYSVSIHGKMYPIIGNVCMDLTMIDLGDNQDITLGDEVILLGPTLPIERLAEVCQTIPYEIISTISPRVKRVYTKE
jgi:Alr-MurF fusion protein